jgi:signal transduction histidine kinase
MLAAFVSTAQSEYERELLLCLDTASSNLIRSKIYRGLSAEANNTNPNKGCEYAEKALTLAERAKDMYSETYAYYSLGYCLYLKSQYKTALPFFEKSLVLSESIKDTAVIILSLSVQGNIYSFFGQHEKGVALIRKALGLALNIRNQSKISLAYNDLGIMYLETGAYEEAEFFLKKAKKIDIASNDKYGLDRTLNNLSLIYTERGQFELALSTLYSSIDTGYDKASLDYGIYSSNVGDILYSMGQYDSALVYYLDYLKISRAYESQLDVAYALGQVAHAQLDMGNSSHALQNRKKSNSIYKELNVKIYLSSGLTALAKIYIKQKDYNQAKEALQKAEIINKSIFNKKQKGEILKLKGELYFTQKKFNTAISYYKKSLKIFDEIESKSNYATTLYRIALAEYQLENYQAAIDNASLSLRLIQASKYKSYLDDLYEILSKSYAAVNNFEQAYYYQSELKSIQDSLLTLKKTNRFAALQTEFQVTERENENKMLKSAQAQSKITIQHRTIIGISLGFGLLIVLILTGFLISTNNQKREYNEVLESRVEERTEALQIANNDLQKTNKELERFAYIASHDLKEPLRNIAGFAFLLKRKVHHLLDVEALEYMEFILRGTRQMNELIVSVLEFSGLSGGILRLKEMDTNAVIEIALGSIKQALKERNVEVQIAKFPKIIADESKISSIFKNLIENGIKYNKTTNPIINIGYESDETNHILSVKDNGIGIEQNYKDLIFEMFKRLHTKQDYEGTGIGLAFSKKVIVQHGGEIWLAESDQNGSTFKFSIPKTIHQ